MAESQPIGWGLVSLIDKVLMYILIIHSHIVKISTRAVNVWSCMLSGCFPRTRPNESRFKQEQSSNSWRASAFSILFVFFALFALFYFFFALLLFFLLFCGFILVPMNFHAKSGVCSSKNGRIMSTFVHSIFCDYPYELPFEIWSLSLKNELYSI